MLVDHDKGQWHFKNGLSTRIVDQFKDRKVFVPKNKAAILSRMPSEKNVDEAFYLYIDSGLWSIRDFQTKNHASLN